ncbi:catalase family protein [Robbsia sp. KACC 23696]|uniref:catalase family protein n=1 Tax=Robbsia sp. KACC 23696 TaxID=3149231 RepID=UPI00325C00F6
MTALHPIRFQPDMEVVPEDEAQTTAELIEALHTIQAITTEDYPTAVRSVHAKSHGIVKGTVQVLDNLPPQLAQGLFAKPAHYPVVMRFSTNPGDILDDRVSTPRGLALKIMLPDDAATEGGVAAGLDGTFSQDFVMQNAPKFTAPTPKAFLGNLKLLAKTTDKAEGLKVALSAVLRGTESLIEKVGSESGAIKSMGGHPMTHVLGETFYTMVPLLYGEYYGKVSVAPVSPGLQSLTDQAVSLKDNPDGLRAAVVAFFSQNDAEWEIRVQLAADREQFPIEDASQEWPESVSPYVAVARITVPKQDAWSAEVERSIDQCSGFSPWHCLSAHRPLGGIMRSRKPAYEASQRHRFSANGCPFAAAAAAKNPTQTPD